MEKLFMIYKKSVGQDEPLVKKSVYTNFDILEEKIEGKYGHVPKNSLHSNIDINEDRFLEEDVEFFFISDGTEENEWFINYMEFEIVDKLPRNIHHIAGYYNQRYIKLT